MFVHSSSSVDSKPDSVASNSSLKTKTSLNTKPSSLNTKSSLNRSSSRYATNPATMTADNEMPIVATHCPITLEPSDSSFLWTLIFSGRAVRCDDEVVVTKCLPFAAASFATFGEREISQFAAYVVGKPLSSQPVETPIGTVAVVGNPLSFQPVTVLNPDGEQ